MGRQCYGCYSTQNKCFQPITPNPPGTGRKSNVHKTLRKRPERLMCVQFIAYVQGESNRSKNLINGRRVKIGSFFFLFSSIKNQLAVISR